MLAAIKINRGIQELYKLCYQELLGTTMGKEDQDRLIKKLFSQLKENEERLSRMQLMLVDGQIDVDDYAAIKSRLSSEIAVLKERVKKAKEVKLGIAESIKAATLVVGNMNSFYESASPRTRLKLLSSSFGESLVISQSGIRTPNPNPAFVLLLRLSGVFEQKKKGQTLSNLGLSREVVPAGIEPTSNV